MIIDFSVKKCSAGIVQNWVREDPEKAAICPLYKHACPLFNTDLFPATVKKQETETFSYYCGDSKRFSTEEAANEYRDKIIKYQNALNYKLIEGNIVSDLFMNITPSLKPGDWYVKEEFWFLPDHYYKIELLKEYLLFRFPDYKKEVENLEILNETSYHYVIVLEETERGDYSPLVFNKRYTGVVSMDHLKDKILSILPKN